MDAIIKVRNSEYARYEELLMERDALKKEARIYQDMYIHEFGDLMTEVFQKKIDCISKKKSIAFCQQALNRGEAVDQDKLKAYLEEQMADYNAKLKAMVEASDACRKLHTSPEVVVNKVKHIYRKLAKVIHPDINEQAKNNPKFIELWNRVAIAYRMNDLKEMEELEVLVSEAMINAGMNGMEIEIPDIADKIAQVEEEIHVIKTTDPYMYKMLLEDPIAVEEKNAELQKELKEYTDYEKQLDEILMDLAAKGMVVTWKMN